MGSGGLQNKTTNYNLQSETQPSARRPVSCKPSSLTLFDGHTAWHVHQKMVTAGTPGIPARHPYAPDVIENYIYNLYNAACILKPLILIENTVTLVYLV